jgi:membrane carboxypeptidase/penicillin-binding protein
MRVLFRVLVSAVLIVVLLVACAMTWLYFSTSGLPDVNALRAYAPSNAGVIPANECAGALSVLPIKDLKPLYPVFLASEGGPKQARHTSLIARSMPCAATRRPLEQEWIELRLTIQISRQFSEDEQLAIILNRSYFSDGQYGIAAASQHFFGIPPTRLDMAQSALLMGLISRPNYYSPSNHPERAMVRRNAVLESMKSQGSLTAAQAATAEALPLELK